MRKMTKLKEKLFPYLFILPGFLFLLIWLVIPMLSALNISLRNWSIVPNAPKPWTGLLNYKQVLSDSLFWLSLKNTFIYAMVTVIGQMILGLLVALLIDNLIFGKVFFRAVYYLPVVTSWVVVSLLFKFLFNSSPSGFINYLLCNVFHLVDKPVSWLTEANTAFIAIDTLGIWKGIGFAMIIFLAALQSISQDLYESAEIDGAGTFSLFRYITFPALVPTIATVSVMLLIGAFQTYVPVAMITKGGPLHRTEMVVSYIYNTAFTNLNFGYSSALSYIFALIVFGLSRLQLRAFGGKKG